MNNNIWKKIGIGAGIAGGVIAGVALVPMALGFGTAGIVGGSIAAGIQALIGNVAAGSVFAVCTSLGMTGVFASTAAVGTILGAGGLAAYIKGKFSPDKDATLIRRTLGKGDDEDDQDNPNRGNNPGDNSGNNSGENKKENQGDNPEIIIKLLEIRFPDQREEIRKKYNEKYKGSNFDQDVLNYIPLNLREHVENMLKPTNEINIKTQSVKTQLNNKPFEDYFKKDFIDYLDAILINSIISNKDNPLLIVRLLNYRDEDQRKKIDSKFREIKGNKSKKMITYILDIMPNHSEITYLHLLLEGI